MKKINTAALTVTAFAFAAVSSSAMASPSAFLGAQLGYQDTSLELSDPGLKFDSVSISGMAGSVFGGVKYALDGGFFVGVEANFGTSGADSEVTLEDLGIELEAKQSYGIAALAGFDVSDNTTLYGRLGYQRTDYELTVRWPGFSESDDETFGGARFGVGMESAFSEQVAVRLDWSQTHYSSKSFDGTKIEPTENLFQVGVVFKF